MKTWLAFALLGVLVLLAYVWPVRPKAVSSPAAQHLRVLTINSPTTCYDGAGGLAGYECELVKHFAEHLGRAVTIVVVPSQQAALDALARGEADFVAAGITVTPERAGRFQFSQPIDQVRSQMLYRMGDGKPRAWEDLQGVATVVAGSSHEEALKQQEKPHNATESQDEETLLYQVAEGQVSYTVAASNLVAINQRYYPRLRVAFDVSAPQVIAWAFPMRPDKRSEWLYRAANAWLGQHRSTLMAELHDRYYGFVAEDFFASVQLLSHIQSRLPLYRPHFEQTARLHGLDWRMLAAIGYQESHWQASAESYTGVRGLMMLTQDTANHLGVNREDPTASIRGGAKYYREMLDLVPVTVPEPDRQFMALAAYNLGPGHLIDVRALVASQGKDPDRWLDVRDALPLLSQPHWFKRLKYGYARGREALEYVNRIRGYYDVLRWLSEEVPANRVASLLGDAHNMAVKIGVEDSIGTYKPDPIEANPSAASKEPTLLASTDTETNAVGTTISAVLLIAAEQPLTDSNVSSGVNGEKPTVKASNDPPPAPAPDVGR